MQCHLLLEDKEGISYRKQFLPTSFQFDCIILNYHCHIMIEKDFLLVATKWHNECVSVNTRDLIQKYDVYDNYKTYS